MLKKFWRLTPFYAIYDWCYSRYLYNKDVKAIGDIFYSNAFKGVIKKYLRADLKKDWAGRLYGITNPNIDETGKFDVSTMIIEIDGDNTNNNDWVRNWIFKQLQMVGTLFQIEKLYDYISLDFEHVGPKELDNYLLIFDISSRKLKTRAFRNMLINIISWAAIISAGYVACITFIP